LKASATVECVKRRGDRESPRDQETRAPAFTLDRLAWTHDGRIADLLRIYQGRNVAA
jgi:hypothetical protein